MIPFVRRFIPDRRSPEVAPSPALWRLGVVDWIGKYPVLERRRTEFGLWWGNRTPRERRLLIALSGTLTLVLLIMAIYRPLADARARAVADIHTYEVLAAQLRIAGPELARLRAIDRSASPATVSSSASSFGLAVSRLEPQDGMIRVTLQEADFAKVIQWLVQLEGSTTLRVSQVRMDRGRGPGLVNAQITLKT
jgi:general secretion pathway protein M